MPKSRYQGLFKPVQAGFKVPPQFSITDAQSFLQAVASATSRHRVGRTFTDENELTFSDEGASRLKVVPAGSQDELEQQVRMLKAAFEREEGRPPTERDDEFWQAVTALIDAYEGPHIADFVEVFAPILEGRR
jgi:hypothetical protein